MKKALHRRLKKGISIVAACAIMATNFSPWLATAYAGEMPEEALYEGADEFYEAAPAVTETPEETQALSAASAEASYEVSAEPTETPDAAEPTEALATAEATEAPDENGIAEGVEVPDDVADEDAFDEEVETPDGQILENAPSVIFEQSTDEVRVTVVAGVGVFPEGTTMEVVPAEDEETISKVSETVEDEKTKVTGVKAVEVTFYNAEHEEIEPSGPVFVTLEDLTKIKEEGAQEAKEEETDEAQITEEAKAVHVTDEGECALMASASGEDIQNLPMEWEEDQAKESVKKIEELSEEATVAFIAETFSTYALVYTVDFEYSVNGQTYQFSLPGGGYVSFSDLVEVLGITGDKNNGADEAATEEQITDGMLDVTASDVAKKFVSDVVSVEFSSPELVWVQKVDAETTVGELKEENGLECEYSADLTEEQVEAINDTEVGSGDWALISMKAFDTEETLTVTLKDTEVFTIRVTDAQIKKTVIDAKGEAWEITVTYGEDAQIPEGARLEVEEILPEDKEYAGYYQKSLEKIGVIASETEGSETSQDASANEDSEEPGRKAASDYARIFNIEIWADDQKVEPAANVTVDIKLLDAPEETEAVPQVVHFAKDGTELMELEEQAENTEDEGIRFVTDEFSVYSVVYTVDFLYEVNGKVYGFTMQGADSVSLRALIEALHVYELSAGKKDDAGDNGGSGDRGSKIEDEVTNDDLNKSADTKNSQLDSFMRDIKDVKFSDTKLLVPAKVEKDTTVGQIKTDLKLFPTYPLGLKQSEVLALNAKEYTAGDWVLISMKAFDTKETLTITMNTGESFDIQVTDAQDAVMIGDRVQTISNPAGTTIDLFDYWVVSQDIAGRDAWGDLNQSWGGHDDTVGDNGYNLNGSGNNKGINSSTDDTEHGHALKFSPAWDGTVYNGTKEGTHRYFPNWDSGDHDTHDDVTENWRSLNYQGKNGLNSYTGDADPFQGIVGGTLVDGYPVLTDNHEIGSNGESLAYLFNPGITHDGKASYPSVDQLLYVDKNGYYTYDSRDYRADYNNGTFVLTEQTSDNTEIRGFWPFGTQNFWTGLHINTQFSMPVYGQVLNPRGEYKDMQFEFSGDDDTWLYVDGVLVGDGGGIHNRTEIDVNFAKGTVTVTGKKGGGHSGDFEETKYLDDLFKAAEKYNEDEWEDIGDGSGHKRFKAGTYHTFDMFYLERGGGESNLYIHYNLVSTADFTAHKSYYGEDETDILKRDQFQFELIGLDGKYRSVKNNETGNYELVQEDTTSDAIMPHASGSGEGTVASPHYEDNVSTILSNGGTVNSQVYITGVTEDGNINFGSALISEIDMNEADRDNSPVYKYIIREIVPDDAVNQDGITWASATDAQKAAGGFVKDQVTYDGTVYYMTGRVTSWTETNASGQEVVRHGISKTYYTDDTYTTVKDDVDFANFENRFTPDYGSVDFTKVDGAGDPLAGAEFTLYKDEACTIPAADLDTEGNPVWTAGSDSNGKVSFENVRVGTYYMKETTAPTGYVLDETIYKVVIENSKDKTKKSKITILGDESEAAVTEIANAKSGKITVLKKWLDAYGNEINGGSNSATVQLKRKHMVAEGGESSGNHTVTVQMTVEDGGVKYGTPVTQTVTGDTVIIEWDDEWQRNFNWNLTIGDKSYDGWIGDEVVTTENYTFEQISVDGRSRRLTIPNAQGDISLTTKYWVNWLHSDGNHWNNLNRPVISAIAQEPNYVAEDDTAFNNEKHTQVLSGNSWSHTWNIGGTEASHSGFDFPAMDDNGKNYLYYVVELDQQGNPIEIGGSPIDGYILYGYSANNNTGISNQGVITVYNQSESPTVINVVIKKTDDAENSTNYLAGAVFKLMYRADSSGTFAGVSKESVPELDNESKFTVPKTGITLEGLVDGEYQLKEISPPAGYVVVNENPVTFTVSGGAITSTKGTITGVRYTAATATSDAEFIIPNTPGEPLPGSGGPGTRGFLYTGLALMVFAAMAALAAMVWRRKRV